MLLIPQTILISCSIARARPSWLVLMAPVALTREAVVKNLKIFQIIFLHLLLADSFSGEYL